MRRFTEGEPAQVTNPIVVTGLASRFEWRVFKAGALATAILNLQPLT
jgi:hypothetical protein